MPYLGQSLVWGSGNSPTIYVDIWYESQRSGADMQYRLWFQVRKPSGSYGFRIRVRATLNGTQVTNANIKDNTSTSWTSYSMYAPSSSTWYTVANKTSGTVSLSVRVDSPDTTVRDDTWTYALPVSAAGSSISAANGTLGEQQTITLTRYDTTFIDTIKYSVDGGSTYTTLTTVPTGSEATYTYNWTPAVATFAPYNTTGTAVPIVLATSTTTSGGTAIETKTISITEAIPASVVPTATMTVADTKKDRSNRTVSSTYGGYVQGESIPQVTLTGTGIYGSTIEDYSITADGVSYGVNPLTLSPFTTTGSKTISGYAIDSRGRVSTTQSTSVTVIPYSAPVITSTNVYRCNSSGNAQADGAYVKLVMVAASTTAVPASGTNKNTVIYRVRYKASTASTYSTHTWYTDVTTTSVSNLTTSAIALATTATMEVIFEVIDQFETTQAVRTVPLATKFIDANDTKTGLALGMVSTKAGFQVAFDTYYSGATVKHETTGDAVFSDSASTSGKTDKNVYLHDSADNNLYPMTKAGNISGQVAIANGGTGASTASAALLALMGGANFYEASDSGSIGTAAVTRQKTYTATSAGYVMVGATMTVSGTDYGFQYAKIEKGSDIIAYGADYFNVSSNNMYGANAFAVCQVAVGDVITVTTGSTRYHSGNTFTFHTSALAFGCTLTLA